MTLSVRTLASVCHNKAVACALARASADLMSRFDMRYSLDRWDLPAIAVFDGQEVVGVAQLTPSEKAPLVDVSLAWCSPDHPKALLLLARAVRSWAADHSNEEIQFTAHTGNEQMHRLANLIGATSTDVSYRVLLPTSVS